MTLTDNRVHLMGGLEGLMANQKLGPRRTGFSPAPDDTARESFKPASVAAQGGGHPPPTTLCESCDTKGRARKPRRVLSMHALIGGQRHGEPR